MGHLLVVANQTLAGPDLVSTLRQRVKDGVTDVWVVVPATTPGDDHVLLAPGLGGGGMTVGTQVSGIHIDAFDVALRRLEKGLILIGGLGCRVDGEVGDADPMHAVEDVLGRLEVDEVVISTLPHRRGREQLVRGEIDTVRGAARALEDLEDVWRGRFDRFGKVLADHTDVADHSEQETP